MSGPGELAAILQEWDDRLESAATGRDQAVAFSLPVPVSAFVRMELALLVLIRESDGALAADLQRLDRSLRGVHAALASVPHRCTRELVLACITLADFLEVLVGRQDESGGEASVGDDPAWLQLAARFQRAAGPCGVMDLLMSELETWTTRWGRSEPDAETERDLAAHWRRVREYGDALFEQGVLDSLGFPPGKNR
ncbi:hypothetical protein CO151_08105 [bacterium CG_4_9_14_3_um_filter_65_15]|nr:MAG: hypothetical protein CO151_08105 [bacterium CG_4_9_14_3_um_filter_65_15]